MTLRKCKAHGLLWHAGRYCPVCGKQAASFFESWRDWLWLYFFAGAVGVVIGVAVLTVAALREHPGRAGWVLLVGVAVLTVAALCYREHQKHQMDKEAAKDWLKSRQAQWAAERAAVDGLPDGWRILFYTLEEMATKKKMLIALQSYAQQSSPSSLTPDQTRLFLGFFTDSDKTRADAFAILSQYVVESKVKVDNGNHTGVGPPRSEARDRDGRNPPY